MTSRRHQVNQLLVRCAGSPLVVLILAQRAKPSLKISLQLLCRGWVGSPAKLSLTSSQISRITHAPDSTRLRSVKASRSLSPSSPNCPAAAAPTTYGARLSVAPPARGRGGAYECPDGSRSAGRVRVQSSSERPSRWGMGRAWDDVSNPRELIIDPRQVELKFDRVHTAGEHDKA